MEKNIAVIQNKPGIGDMCLYLPFVHFLSKYYSSKITLFTKSTTHAKSFLSNDPLIKEIIYIDDLFRFKNFFINSQIFKKKKFDTIFIFSYGLRIPAFFLFTGVKKIFFYGFLKKRTDIVNDAKNLLIKKLKLNELNLDCKLYLDQKEEFKINNKIIVGIGGSGWNKKWPVESYIDLIRKISEVGNFKFIIAGGKNEKEDFEKIKLSLSNLDLVSLCNLNISECIKFIYGSKLYIGNDTGFMHISGLCGIRSFGLFGDTPTNYISYNKKITAILPDGYTSVGQRSFAMKKISVKNVFEKIQNLLLSSK